MRKKILYEVRIPRGFFRVLDSFKLPGFDGWDVVFNRGEILSIEPSNKTISVYDINKKNWIEKKIDFKQFILSNVYKEFSINTEKLSQTELSKLINQGTLLKFTTTVRALNRRITELDLDPSTRIKVEVLVEKLEKLTNKKIKFVELEDNNNDDELIYPSKLYHTIKKLDDTLSEFDVENIKELTLNIMANNKIVDKKALRLIIANYKNNLKNAN